MGTHSKEVPGYGTIYTSDGAVDTSVLLGQGLIKSLKNNTPPKEDPGSAEAKDLEALFKGIKAFGKAASAAGSVMSLISRNDAGQQVFMMNVKNYSPYVLSCFNEGNAGFDDCYLTESFNSVLPESSGVFRFTINHDKHLGNVGFDLNLYITDPETKKSLKTKLRFYSNSNYNADDNGKFGLQEITVQGISPGAIVHGGYDTTIADALRK